MVQVDLFTAGAVFAIILLAYHYLSKRYEYFLTKPIPCLKPTFLVGNTGAMLFRQRDIAAQVKALYYAFPDFKITGFYDLMNPIFMLRDPDVIKKIGVKDFDVFMDHTPTMAGATEAEVSGEQLFANSLFALRGSKWRDMRATLSPAFTGSKMRHMFELVAECAVSMSDFFKAEAKAGKKLEFEMKDTFSRFGNDVIATVAFGIKVDSMRDRENDFFVIIGTGNTSQQQSTVRSSSNFSIFFAVIYRDYPRVCCSSMPRAGRGRGSSSAASKNPRSSSTGRVQKGKHTNAASTVIAHGSVPSDVIDESLLHVSYRPRESPVRTRQSTRASGSTSGQQQQQQSTSTTTTTTSNVPTRNEFEILSGEENNTDSDSSNASDDDYDDELARKQEKKKKCNSPKERRPPPIFVLETLADDIDELLEGLQYCLKISKTSVQVITHNKQNFDLVVKKMKLRNFKFFTFDPAEKVPVKIVLQGYPDRPISDLEEHLSGIKVKPREVKVLSKSTTVTGTYTLYLLYFDRGSVKIQDLRRIKALDGFFVTWRFYTKNPTDAAQCHRCQKFGHGSRNCNLPPRCVKCGETHFTERCNLPRKDQLGENAQQHKARVKCANCGGNHTANFRGCAARKKYLEEQDKKKKAPASRQPPKTSSSNAAAAGGGAVPSTNPAFPPGWGGSYARVAASGSGTSPGQADVTGDDLFTLPEFFALAGEMLTRFRACRNKAEQFQALSELMMKYIYNG